MRGVDRICNRCAVAGVRCPEPHNRTMQPTEALVSIVLFISMFGILYVLINSRHRQRMAMIEKGLDLNAGSPVEVHKPLRNGMVMAGAGLGLFLGYLMDTYMPGYGPDGDMGDTPLPYFMMILLCSGAALIVYHIIVRRKQQG